MGHYEFSLHNLKSKIPRVLAIDLASDVDASVESFNLLRDDYAVSAVHVTIDGRAVLVRTRFEGKSILRWSR